MFNNVQRIASVIFLAIFSIIINNGTALSAPIKFGGTITGLDITDVQAPVQSDTWFGHILAVGDKISGSYEYTAFSDGIYGRLDIILTFHGKTDITSHHYDGGKYTEWFTGSPNDGHFLYYFEEYPPLSMSFLHSNYNEVDPLTGYRYEWEPTADMSVGIMSLDFPSMIGNGSLSIIGNGWIWDQNYSFIGGNGGIVNVTFDITPVPEPATMLLFGTGIAGLAAVGRRKRS